tara:strand:- start:3711 stop:3968 length:258 start_codon:yes stop_codon:yes gene_type:complete
MARKSRVPHKNEGQPFPVTSARVADEPAPASALPAETGPTVGYIDNDDGTIGSKIFLNGVLPDGWVDTPAKCKNEYDRRAIVEVK